MQTNSLKLKNTRKKRKTIGRGGKTGTYSGRGLKGQKARSGGNVDPLFEGGRSTLVDHMKKKRGFSSKKPRKNIVKLSALDKKFSDGEKVNVESLVSKGFLKKKDAKNGVKILNDGKFSKKLEFSKELSFSRSASEKVKAGSKK